MGKTAARNTCHGQSWVRSSQHFHHGKGEEKISFDHEKKSSPQNHGSCMDKTWCGGAGAVVRRIIRGDRLT